MQAAAVALTHGWDPIAYLALPRDEAVIAHAVLIEAERLRGEFGKAIADHTANRTAALLAPAITKNTTRLIRFLANSFKS